MVMTTGSSASSSSSCGLGQRIPRMLVFCLVLVFAFAFLSYSHLLQQHFASRLTAGTETAIAIDITPSLLKVHANAGEYAQVRDLKCVKWRQTGRCSPDGPREPLKDKACDEWITAGVSGYCEVMDVNTNETFRVMLSACRSVRGNAKYKCDYAPEFGNYAVKSERYVVETLTDPSYALPNLNANVASGANATLARSNERGIVMVVYPRLLAGIFATIRVLRARNCVLPIEFWYRPDELNTDDNVLIRELVSQYGPISLHEITDSNAMRFKSKIYAIYNSRFHQVMFLDADNAPVRDPTFLFESHQFQASGAIFWPDYWSPRNSMFDINKQSLLWQLVGVEFTEMFEQESAQLLIDRKRHAKALEMLMFYAFDDPNFFDAMRLVWGDKDLFRLAWLKTNSSFFMVPHPPAIGGKAVQEENKTMFCGMTMIQHDVNGEILFMHRNKKKLDGFHDETCWTHVQQLKKDAPLEKYIIKWKPATPFFGETLDFCYDASDEVLEYFDLLPMENMRIDGFEDEIIAYAAESTVILNG